MRSLGLDVGDRRIGVAMSDPSGIVASPLTIIERKNDIIDIETISNIVRRNEVGHIIVGLPLAADGVVGMQAEKVYDFVSKLKASIDIPLQFRDESFSTDSARKLMLQTKSKKTRRNTRDDAIAAAYILQHFLEEQYLANLQEPETID
ncbi:MAG TPA: Holliday junction resolvase RuvX [Dehalococcoidia bacterium]|nr:Holliday junction resolvase RuvX [Dehalococcoidia bacterium]